MVPISSDSMVVVVVTVQDLDAAKASEEKRRKAREWCDLKFVEGLRMVNTWKANTWKALQNPLKGTW